MKQTSALKNKSGGVDFEKILSVPRHDRIVGLVEKIGEDMVHAIVVVMLTKFSNTLNLIRPMTPDQIITCAYEMVLSSGEDNISIEDLQVFFSTAISGRWGKILDRMDQNIVLTMFEEYREQRHQQMIAIRDLQNAKYRSISSDTDRISESYEEGVADFRNIVSKYNIKKEIE